MYESSQKMYGAFENGERSELKNSNIYLTEQTERKTDECRS